MAGISRCWITLGSVLSSPSSIHPISFLESWKEEKKRIKFSPTFFSSAVGLTGPYLSSFESIFSSIPMCPLTYRELTTLLLFPGLGALTLLLFAAPMCHGHLSPFRSQLTGHLLRGTFPSSPVNGAPFPFCHTLEDRLDYAETLG